MRVINNYLEKRQCGSVAIEFAVVFALFFMIIYAIISYSLPILLTFSFKQISADAARAAVRVDPALSQSDYSNLLAREVTRVVENSWIPASWRQGNCPMLESEKGTWQALPAVDDSSPSYGYMISDSAGNHTLRICLQRMYNDEGSMDEIAIIPRINLFGVRIPMLPAESNGNVVLRSYSIVSL